MCSFEIVPRKLKRGSEPGVKEWRRSRGVQSSRRLGKAQALLESSSVDEVLARVSWRNFPERCDTRHLYVLPDILFDYFYFFSDFHYFGC